MAENMLTIPENVKKLSNHVAGVRREALVNILEYIKCGFPIAKEEGDVLKSGILTMFVEKQPLVYLQFIDTLEGLLQSRREQIEGWISMIISKFLQKLGTDSIRENVEKRIKIFLVNLTKYCDGNLLLNCLFRAFSDASQPMNRKTIKESLLYLGQICFRLEQGHFYISADTSLGFATIAGWYGNKNAYKDIQRAARYALLALFRLNSSTFTHLQSELAANKEPFVRQLINEEVLKSDSTSPLEEYMFLPPFQESIDTGYYSTTVFPSITPPLKYSIETTSSLTTTPSSTNSDALEVTSPKRSASTEDMFPLPTAFKSTQYSKKISTLPRMPKGAKSRTKLSLQALSGDAGFSPSPSRLPLSRTQSVGEGLRKKSSKSADYSSIPKKYTSKIPRAEPIKDDIYY